jgi:hypothetical protein
MEGFGSSRVENKVGGAGCYDKSFKYTGCEEHCASAESGDSAGPFHLARSKKNQCRIHAMCASRTQHRNTSNVLLHLHRSVEHMLKIQPSSLPPSLRLRADERLAAARLPSAQAF